MSDVRDAAEADDVICPETIKGQGAPEGCMSSGCMAWRWFGLRDAEGTIASHTVALRQIRTQTYEVGQTPVGYCGLAGVPR